MDDDSNEYAYEMELNIKIRDEDVTYPSHIEDIDLLDILQSMLQSSIPLPTMSSTFLCRYSLPLTPWTFHRFQGSPHPPTVPTHT